MGRRVMVASSQRLATQTGLKVLAKGGNAIDAAVAMVCTSSVVEPHSTGIGGDAFTLMYLALEKKLIGMNASELMERTILLTASSFFPIRPTMKTKNVKAKIAMLNCRAPGTPNLMRRVKMFESNARLCTKYFF